MHKPYTFAITHDILFILRVRECKHFAQKANHTRQNLSKDVPLPTLSAGRKKNQTLHNNRNRCTRDL